MFGRFAKVLWRLFIPVILIVAMGSSKVVAGASEAAGGGDVDTDAYEYFLESNGDIENIMNFDILNTDMGNDSDSLGMDVYFYIRLDGGEAGIPDEPVGHASSEYSSAIKIQNAVYYDGFIYDRDVKEVMVEDGFTAESAVEANLMALPTASQIQEVYPSFDPEKQFVFWYVLKNITPSLFGRNARMHVDGIIVDRTITGEYPGESQIGEGKIIDPKEDVNPVSGSGIENESGNPENDPRQEEPEVPVVSDPIISAEPEKVSSNLTFEVFSTNTEPVFEYDGEDHLVGGYVIRVIDSEDGTIAEFTYGPFGDYLGVTFKTVSHLEDLRLSGTTFTYKGVKYNVNIDSAYLWVKNPGTYEIPLLYKNNVVTAADIIILDETGKVVDSDKLDAKTPANTNSVSKRKITIEAGSTVQNDNGTTITNDEVEITSGSLLPGHKLVTSIVGSQTGPGESVNEITSYDIVDENGKSYKSMYDVTSNKGWLILVKPTQVQAQGETQPSEKMMDDQVKDNEKTGQVAAEEPKEKNVASAGADTETEALEDIIISDNTDSDIPQVLGVRRSSTGDISLPPELRLSFIVLCLMAIMIINIKRNQRN